MCLYSTRVIQYLRDERIRRYGQPPHKDDSIPKTTWRSCRICQSCKHYYLHIPVDCHFESNVEWLQYPSGWRNPVIKVFVVTTDFLSSGYMESSEDAYKSECFSTGDSPLWCESRMKVRKDLFSKVTTYRGSKNHPQSFDSSLTEEDGQWEGESSSPPPPSGTFSPLTPSVTTSSCHLPQGGRLLTLHPTHSKMLLPATIKILHNFLLMQLWLPHRGSCQRS